MVFRCTHTTPTSCDQGHYIKVSPLKTKQSGSPELCASMGTSIISISCLVHWHLLQGFYLHAVTVYLAANVGGEQEKEKTKRR